MNTILKIIIFYYIFSNIICINSYILNHEFKIKKYKLLEDIFIINTRITYCVLYAPAIISSIIFSILFHIINEIHKKNRSTD